MELTDIQAVTALLERHGFHFSKAKGQNFLIAAWVPERIAEESGVDKHTGVLEIGPGVGCLTAELAKRAGKVAALEVDARLMPVLGETLAGVDNVDVINADIMKADIPDILENNLKGLTPAVCANLPYNITSPVLTKLIECGRFETVTVMIQREVARRICAGPGTPDYGAFGIFVDFYYQPELLFDVPPSCFEPRPKVTSSVIKLTRRGEPAARTDERLFFKTVRAAFNQRRKTLANALSSGFPQLDKTEIAGCIRRCGLSETVRGEELCIPEFAALTDELGRALNDSSR